MNKNQDVGLLVMRIGIGFPMLLYGLGKLFNGISFIQGILVDRGLPAFFGYGVYVGEVVAPILLLLGYRTRLASLVFAINCITAMLLVQSADVFSLNDNGGWKVELLGIYALVAVGLFFTGAGRLAISSKHQWD
ncbi:DoxX family protein [Myroides sp. M-43]|uniref:DoxX family protein n=1 Tax=Myroides oncorhynchi TaxID=2893756 RepID=UPI001E311188|nr:DoxX family protein [Myroides oncorhynchi]MCC9044452.1 DoxX family protein [Myroides oncorhynchi]